MKNKVMTQLNNRAKLTKAVIFILLLFVMFVAFASLNSEIKADAATLPENIVSGYSGENFRPINGGAGSQTSIVNVDQTVTQPISTSSNMGIYFAGGTEMALDQEFTASKPAQNYTYLLYARFKLSNEIISAMTAGNISSINVSATSASVSQPKFIYNTGTMGVKAFALIIPKNLGPGALLSIIQGAQCEVYNSSENTSSMTKGAVATNTLNHTFNRTIGFKDKGEVIVGYVLQFRKVATGTFGMAGQNPNLLASSFGSASIKVNYQAPVVKLTDFSGPEKEAGLEYNISGLSDAQKANLLGAGHAMGFGSSFNIGVKTNWQSSMDTSFMIFDKFTRSYVAANPGDSFQTGDGNTLNPAYHQGLTLISFSPSNTTAGTHTYGSDTVEISITWSEWQGMPPPHSSQKNLFLYKQDELNNFVSVPQGPAVKVWENGKFKKIVAGNVEFGDPDKSYIYKLDATPFDTTPSPTGATVNEPSEVGQYRLLSQIRYRTTSAQLLSSNMLLNFQITPVSLASGQFDDESLSSFVYEYNGRQHKPDPAELYFDFYDGNRPTSDQTRSYKLTRGTDYLASSYLYSNNVNAYYIGNPQPSLRVSGTKNFTANALTYFNINCLQISGGSDDILEQVGERAGETGSKKVATEIAAFHNTQMYDRDVSGGLYGLGDFPRPNVSYLRLGWSNYSITSGAGVMNQRFFLIENDQYNEDRVSSPFSTGATYSGVSYDAYRELSAALENDSTNPETASNWAVAARYKIDYNSYKWYQDGVNKKIYGTFQIEIAANQNLSGQFTVKYEIIPRNLNTATAEISKYTTMAKIFNPNQQPQIVIPTEIKVYDVVKAWLPIYENEELIRYQPVDEIRVYTFAKNSHTPSGTLYDGFFEDTSASYTLGTNIYVKDNLTYIQRNLLEYPDLTSWTKNSLPYPSTPGNYMIFQVNSNASLSDEKYNYMFRGQIRLGFDISPKAFSTSTKVGTQGSNPLIPSDVIYNGAQLEIPNVTVTDDGYTLSPGVDYQISYSNNQEVSFDEDGYVTSGAVVTVTGIGNYSSYISENFKVLRRQVNDDIIASIYLPSEEYTGNKIIPEVDEFSITFISSTIPRMSGYPYDNTAPLQSKTFTISNIIRPSDPEDPDYDENWPNGNPRAQFEILEGDENTGTNMEAGTEGNWIKIRIISGNFVGTVKAVFEILPMDISSPDVQIIGKTYWSTMGAYKDSVTYIGSQIYDLSIVANHPVDANNTIKVVTPAKTLVLGSEATPCDYYITGWGTNINAGDGLKRDANGLLIQKEDENGDPMFDFLGDPVYEEEPNTGGRLTIHGKGNYTGQYVLKFTILPRDINKTSEYQVTIDQTPTAGYTGTGYRYTGLAINPAVLEVKNMVFEGSPVLVEGTDYQVNYLNFAPDPHENGYNVSVLKGGKITIEGKGNYTGNYIRTFNIVPAEQTVNLLLSPSSDNPSLKVETKAPARADFEINAFSPGHIIVKGKTNAIYPTPRKVRFRVVNPQTGAASDLALNQNIVYQSVVLEDGYAITTAKISFVSNKYGVIRIIAEQYDAAGIITERQQDGLVGGLPYYMYGNYKTISQAAGSTVESKRVYLKRQDSANQLVNLEKTYGDPNFNVLPNLASQAYGNDNFNIAISNTAILDFESFVAGSNTYYFKILNAGTVTITMSHDGFVHPEQIDRAYVSFEKEVTYNIKKRDLFVMFGGFYREGDTTQEIYHSLEYGFFRGDNGIYYTNTLVRLHPLFTYKTMVYGPSGAQIVDGLAYPNRIDKDEPTDVFSSGLSFTIADEMPGVGSISIPMILSDAQQGDKYANYNILNGLVAGSPAPEGYQFGQIQITKKTLTPYVVLSVGEIEVSQLEKTYGEENPSLKYRIEYRGFVGSDNKSVVDQHPIINYAYRTLGSAGPNTAINPHISVNSPSYAGATQYLVGQFADVGTYLVNLTEGDAVNYVIPKITIPLVISKASVQITFGNTVGSDKYIMEHVYTGKEIDLSKQEYFNLACIEVSGLEGGSVPIDAGVSGKFSFRYVHYGSGGTKLLRAPDDAGRHKVEITFTADINDNYKTTTEEMPSIDDYFILEITKVAPRIEMGSVEVQYKEGPLDLADLGIGAQVFGIDEGSMPNPEIIRKADYQFKVAGSAPSSYTSIWPTSMNRYDVKITYTADSTSNYTSLVQEFLDILEITPKDVYIEATSKVYTYRSQAWAYPVGDITGYTSSEKLGTLEANDISIAYKKGDVSVDHPINVGVYDVIVTFDPSDSNYRETTRTFLGLLTIEQYDLYDDNKDEALLAASTTSPRIVNYDGYSKAFLSTEIRLLKPNTHQPPLECEYIAQYIPVGSATPVVPKNAGTYKLVIKYVPTNDNYKMSQDIIYDDVLIINRVNPTVSTYETKQTPFTGSGIGVTVNLVGKNYTENGIVKTDSLPGNIILYYKGVGAPSSDYARTLPIYPGTYDVKVTYTQEAVDNYNDFEHEIGSALIIEKVQPTLQLRVEGFAGSTITIAYEDCENVHQIIKVVAIGRGQNPPLVDNNQGPGKAISIQYKKAGGVIVTDPEESGEYEVFASYQAPILPEPETIYTNVSLVKVGRLIIRNVRPILNLEGLSEDITCITYTYTGIEVPSSVAVITNLEGREAKGTIVYRYRKSTEIEYKLQRPIAAGEYDVQVEYREKQGDDNFSSYTKVFNKAIKIQALDIEVEALYGQGKTFDGVRADDKSLLYYYSYEKEGAKIFGYSDARNAKGDKYDLSNSLYYTENGFAYTIDTASKMVFPDFKAFKVDATKYSFFYVSNGVGINDFVSVGNEETVYQAYAQNSRRLFTVDTINMLAYTQNEVVDYYAISQINDGYFFSILNNSGYTYTIRINPANISQNGDYKVVIDGSQRTFKVNLDQMIVQTQNLQTTYQIFTTAGEIRKPIDGGNGAYETLYFNYNDLVKGVSKTPLFMLFASDGFIYNVLPNSNKTKRMFRLNVETLVFTADDLITRTFNVSELENVYGQNIYKTIIGGKTYVIDLARSFARLDNTQKYTVYNEHEIIISDIGYVQIANLVQLPYPSLYTYNHTYEDAGGIEISTVYIINTANRNVYLMNEVGVLNTATNTIEFEDDTENIEVDFKKIVYKLFRGSTPVDEDIVYNKKLYVKSPGLLNVSDKFYLGGIYVSQYNVGIHNINIAGIQAGPNYSVTATSQTKYNIDKAVVFVIFHADEYLVYDSRIKLVDFEYLGTVATDQIVGSNSTISFEGDRINATLDSGNGFRLLINLNHPNYYIMVNSSPWYRIEKATLPVYTQAEKVVTYTGEGYLLNVTGLDSTYTFSYEGYEGVPLFTEPGKYMVEAVISKLNHKEQRLVIEMTIKKALFDIEPDPITQTLFFGANMPTLTASTDLGTFKFVDGLVLDPRVEEYEWVFVPADSDLFYSRYEGLAENNYIVKGTMNLNVQKSPAKITLKGPLTQNLNKPISIIPEIEGRMVGSDDIIIKYYSSSGEMFDKMPTKAGKYTMVVQYLGDETHEATEYRAELLIKEDAKLNWIWITLGSVVGLGALSSVFFLIRKKKKYK